MQTCALATGLSTSDFRYLDLCLALIRDNFCTPKTLCWSVPILQQCDGSCGNEEDDGHRYARPLP